ncbi:TIM-barrel domain-containing protein [Pyrinomonas methylaliphatogenes]|uniref:Family 31 glycosyl hydrolase, alpha-glucosidase n=1 Tax=Pyrinomonas methylaliphatogenes TaxID=454194 RepID=A0A0B6WV83_9BACT|nr:TIM-barrel domain-containing protein [Pyrinomonas methylaliphatogenes]CDM64169.1 family 31 glycosyl hydrolase, alpha-glucosidase [Pyrinomonas methylaliphatogenes]
MKLISTEEMMMMTKVYALLLLAFVCGEARSQIERSGAALVLRSDQLDARSERKDRSLLLDGFFYETKGGERFPLPAELTARARDRGASEAKMPDGRAVRLSVEREGDDFLLRMSAAPASDIAKWGLSIEAAPDEYYTGLMERVVDGPQAASWAPGLRAAMDLRGQQVEMILKPTTSVYAPFYLSSRGYAVFVRSEWPGRFDFAASDPRRVRIEFEGPALELKIYTARDPARLVRAHALEAGPPILPPRWIYAPWRWRDEHTHRATYYDGTPVTGPFNSEVMEDILMMKAFGIPCGVYWIDRPWGTGLWGYDDFEIDPKRLPNFAAMVRWLNEQGIRTVLWIGPFFQGKMAEEALAKGYNLPDQKRPPNGNNYPLVDFTNPQAKAFWQSGVEKLLRLGVAGFKLDRGEEDIPDDGPSRVFDGRSIRQNRNIYPVLYLKATYDVARTHRGDDFILMPRAAYTGSSPYGVFWGGDIGGTQEGLRASIIAVQRAAVMGYPNWGSDTCGYNQQLLEQEVCGRWLAFSAFTPIMEVGPTRNVGFWNLPRQPSYDTTLIAIWRLYARLHEKLADYSYACAREAHETGMPIVRPLFLIDPRAPEAWTNWWTYLYGPDILVSPIWEKGRRVQEVYLPRGAKWRDAWHPEKVYEGGQTIKVRAELYQIPIFIRDGAKLDLGDLEREYRESLAIAERRPDLKALEAEVKAWFTREPK